MMGSYSRAKSDLMTISVINIYCRQGSYFFFRSSGSRAVAYSQDKIVNTFLLLLVRRHVKVGHFNKF